ncbi:MAG TPA: OsmC family peroxiredoxin, partial [Nakamurella sp.]|jgi:osmotically inducible protein OsmC|nr:OsmC family peroxiredoxin [Nakamurella sp.]
MPSRIARTQWSGGLNDGSGQVELVSSALGTFDVSFPRRTADTAGGVTSPEELIAAAHTSCYCMELSGLIGKAGGTVKGLVAEAEVSLGPDPAGGLRLTGIALTVRGQVEGLDASGFAEVAQQAKLTCPVSKALTGVDITLDASLA